MPDTPTPTPPAPAAPAAPVTPGGETPPATPGAAPDGNEGRGGKDAVLADLARERDKRQALEQQVNALAQSQQERDAALAAALGLKPDEKPEADKLAETVAALQKQVEDATRDKLIADLREAHGIPKEHAHLLTATDPEALAAQATSIGELVKGSAQAPPPAFQQIPGQGHAGGDPASIDALIAEAEKAGDFKKSIALKQQRAALAKKP